MAYSHFIPSKPGALLSLLEGIMNLQGNDGGVSDMINKYYVQLVTHST